MRRTTATTLTIMLLGAGLQGCGDERAGQMPAVAPETPMTMPAPSGDPVEIFLAGIRAFNESDIEGLLGTLELDTVWHVPTAPRPPAKGRKAVAKQLVGFKGMLPDARIEVERVIASGELLAAQTVVTASSRFDGQGVPRGDSRSIGYEALYFVQAPAGPAKATLLYYDRAALRRQLGQMKGDAPPIPRAANGQPEIVRAAGDGDGASIALGVLSAMGAGDLEALRPLLAEGFTYRDVASGERGGFDLLSRALADERRTLAPSRYQMRETVHAGPFVACHWVRKAARADGKGGVTLHGAHVMRLEGGKVASLEAYLSKMELIEQLGMVDAFRAGKTAEDAPKPAPDAGIAP